LSAPIKKEDTLFTRRKQVERLGKENPGDKVIIILSTFFHFL